VQKEVTGTLQDGSNQNFAGQKKKTGTFVGQNEIFRYSYIHCKRTKYKRRSAEVNLVNYSTVSDSTLFFRLNTQKILRIISDKLQQSVLHNRSSSCDHKIPFHRNGFDLDNHIPFKCWYILEC
jgi:hypothetical protein